MAGINAKLPPVPVEARPGEGTAHQIFHAKGETLVSDLNEGISRWRSWIFKGWYDIVLRYRRTVVGPFWLVLTTGTMIGCLTLIGPTLFGAGDPNFIPYMVAGIVSWSFLSVCVTETSSSLLENSSDIRAIRLPYSSFIFQAIFRNLIVYAHVLLIYVFTLAVMRRGIQPNVALFLVNLVIVSLCMVPFGFLAAIACARFRDVQQLIGAIIQVAFLLTPVFWDKSILLGRSARSWVVEYNPLFHLLDALRAPLLGGAPTMHSYLFLAGFFAIGTALAAFVYGRVARRIPFWL